jgi:4-diphosphocytidyl-2-C-methyl-D-erythritol kinase
MLTEKAPAKINLTLEVLGKRPDGFHEIRSIVQAIDLCDTLYFEKAKEISITSDLPGWSAADSLASQAANLLREVTGYSAGVTINIEKRIPLLSGLGGDSSDAAAVLRGLNELWGPKLASGKMKDLAAGLGSDVSFFLAGGTALVEGWGEKVTPMVSLPDCWVVLVVPDIDRRPGKTGRMYAALRPEHFTDGEITERAMAALKRNEFGGGLLFNTFENIAFNAPDMRVYIEHLLKMGTPYVHLAGSGPALFVMFGDEGKANNFYDACRGQRMETYLAKNFPS